MQTGDPAAVIATSQKLIARALRELGEWRLHQAAYPQAVGLFRSALTLEDTPQMRELLSKAEARSGERVVIFAPDPVDLAAPLDESNPGNPRLSPAQLRQASLREKRLRKLLAIAYNDWGATEARQEHYSEALDRFHEAERWDRSIPDLMRNLGMAALKTGDNGEAARTLQIALRQSPNDKLLRSLLAVTQFSVGDYQGATKSFSIIPELAQADPNMAYAWAFSMSRSNQIQQAAAVLDRISPQQLSPEMLVSLGHLYSDIGNYQQALACFREALQKDTSAKDAHDGAGVTLIRMNRPADALPEFEAELNINPDDPNAQYQLAYALLQVSRKDEAVSLLRSLVAAHPEHAQARYQLGKELLEAGQTDDAITNLEAAAKLDPDRAYVHYQLQAAYRRAGRRADANRELQLYRQLKQRDRQHLSIQGAHEGKAIE